MRISLFFLITLIGSIASAQNHKKYYENIDCAVPSLKEVGTMKNGKKEDYWKYYYPCLKGGDVVSEEGKYVNDVKTGLWKYYPPHEPLNIDGVLGWAYSTVSFVNGLEQGEKISYYKGGKIYLKSNYKDGKLVGERIEYLLNGTIISIEDFDTGEIKTYWKNGKLKETGFYAVKKWVSKKGEWKEYYETGVLKAVGSYTDNKKTGTWKEYYDNGQLSAQGTMNGSERIGKWELFHRNGKTSAAGEYKPGGYPKAGTWTTYDSKGQKDGVNIPEPYADQVRMFCMVVDNQKHDEDENSDYVYTFEQNMEAMAGVELASDNRDMAIKKVQVWWDKYHDACKCESSTIVSGRNILKHALYANFDGFIYSIAKEYKLNLNYIDPADKKTALDFAVEEYEKFKKNNPAHSLVKRMENVIKILKDNGAKRSGEL